MYIYLIGWVVYADISHSNSSSKAMYRDTNITINYTVVWHSVVCREIVPSICPLSL